MRETNHKAVKAAVVNGLRRTGDDLSADILEHSSVRILHNEIVLVVPFEFVDTIELLIPELKGLLCAAVGVASLPLRVIPIHGE